ncbi:MAG TPA: cell envelope integrity protein CreD, partial [Chitinophagaceae bacterium]|nr:cell envelope integrity protein CreD [Chitinophagaceae bacterium]
NIIIRIPENIDPAGIQWKDARICIGLSDFKGIEERILVRAGEKDIELSPGLPGNEIDSVGLSAPISLAATDIGKTLQFSTRLKLKGSERLHFIPLAGNSSYALESKWPAPSFDGNNLPSERAVSESGFSAKWVFNKANLPFGTVLSQSKFDTKALAFGVTMVQPADQYAKTERAVKYAILVIGLTFSLFFIVELLQKKPVHPVQYILIGLALVIFYTLLLSFSEFILFDIAYLVAAVATISLITLYVKSHFGNWRAAGIFSLVLAILYVFIFVLVRLEDTALLVGSIGLFLILAIAMYLSRKIDWYGKN